MVQSIGELITITYFPVKGDPHSGTNLLGKMHYTLIEILLDFQIPNSGSFEF